MSELAKRIKYLRHLVMESAKVTTVDYFTVDELTAILAALEDAERYRWLRAAYAKGQQTYFAEYCSDNEAEIDAAIDAARK